MPKEQVILLVLAVVFCLVKTSSQCLPPLNWILMSVEERVRRAPLVIRATLAHKQGQTGGLEELGPFGTYTACLKVSHVYKGQLSSANICAGGFGSPVFCKTDLAYGISYVIFLNVDPYSARYEFINSAAIAFSEKVFDEVNKGVCCPKANEGIESRCFQTLQCPLVKKPPSKCYCFSKFLLPPNRLASGGHNGKDPRSEKITVMPKPL